MLYPNATRPESTLSPLNCELKERTGLCGILSLRGGPKVPALSVVAELAETGKRLAEENCELSNPNPSPAVIPESKIIGISPVLAKLPRKMLPQDTEGLGAGRSSRACSTSQFLGRRWEAPLSAKLLSCAIGDESRQSSSR